MRKLASLSETWERVLARTEPDGDCLVWLGARQPSGHGVAWLGPEARTTGTHRIAWLALRGDIPRGLFVLHDCDNPPCVNVAHLRLGTQGENMADARARAKCYKMPGRPGDGAPPALLWNAQAAAIRVRYTDWLHQVANDYGVAPHIVQNVLRHKTYKESK